MPKVTPTVFRRIALSFPGAEERRHMNHPDFRVAGKIFATLGYPNKNSGMVKLTPEQQREFLHDHPAAFRPCGGAWGIKGATNFQLSAIGAKTLRTALSAAWRNTAPKTAALPEME